MRLIRVYVREEDSGYSLSAEFKTPEGKRFRTSLGKGLTPEGLEKALAAAYEAKNDIRKIVAVGRV